MNGLSITDKREFNQAIKQNKLVLCAFKASWCAPCKLLSQELYEFGLNLNDKVTLIKVDVDECPEVANGLKVNSVPTLIVFDSGKESERVVGLKTKAQIAEIMIKYL